MTDPITELRAALECVPRVFLNSQDLHILVDARTSLDVLESLARSLVSVVLVGCTGVGKSHLINEIGGAEISEVSALRPTTLAVVSASSTGSVEIGYASEHVLVPRVSEGIVLVDTPGWEIDRSAVEAVLASADVAVLVVSPARYADATTWSLWERMESVPERKIVLNRLSGTARERSELLGSVQERFGMNTVAIVAEHGPADEFSRTLLDDVAGLSMHDDRAAIARAAASKAGRYLAGALTASAVDLGRLEDAVDASIAPELPGGGFVVLEDWMETRDKIVGYVRQSIGDLDREIVEVAHNEVAHRMLDSLEQWESSGLERSLEEWRSDTAARFVSQAGTRWRRPSALKLLETTAWKVGANPTVHVARRAKRLMGADLDSAIRDVHGDLHAVVSAALVQRKDLWRCAIAEAGSFKPGELLSASERIAGS